MKKTKLKLFIVFIFIFMTIFVTNKVQAVTRIENLDFDITVNEDSSIDVIENLRIKIRDKDTISKYFLIKNSEACFIDNVSIKDLKKDKEFFEVEKDLLAKDRYSIDNSSRIKAIFLGVGLLDDEATREYQIKYTFHNAINVYNDCADFYWNVLGYGSNQFPVDSITGNIHFPTKIEDKDIKIWKHVLNLDGEINQTDDSNIYFSVNDVPAGCEIGFRIVFPNSIFDKSENVYDSDAIKSIIEEEKNYVESENNIKEDSINAAELLLGYILPYFFIIVTVVCIYYQISVPSKIIGKSKKGYVPNIDVEYYRDVPREDATPAEAVTLLYKSSNATQLFFGNVFSATLLDLELKGFLDVANEEVDGVEKTNIILTNSSNVDINELKKDELLLYNYIKSVLEVIDKDRISVFELQTYMWANSDDIKNLFVQISNASSDFLHENEYIDKSEEEIKAELIGTQLICGFWEFATLLVIVYLVSSPILLIIFSILFFAMIVSFVFGIVLSKKAINKINVFTQKAIDEMDKWKGYKEFLKDFTKLEEKEFDSLVVWQKHLIFATAFGVADKVIDQLQIVFPTTKYDSYSDYCLMCLARNISTDGQFEKFNNYKKMYK